MKYLARALQQMYNAVTKHWLILLVLIVLQLSLFVSLGYIGLTYQMNIFENIQGVLDPIQSANYNATSLQEGGLFTTEYARVYESYNLLVQNVIQFVGWLAGLFLIGNGVLWVMTSFLSHPENNWKKIIGSWLRYMLLSILFLGIPLLISVYALWQMMKAGTGVESITSMVQWFGYGLLCFYGLLQIAAAFISAATWKEWWNKITGAFKKVHWVLLTLLINIAVIAMSVSLLVVVMGYESFTMLVMASLILVIVIVLTRLFLVTALQELVHERNSH